MCCMTYAHLSCRCRFLEGGLQLKAKACGKAQGSQNSERVCKGKTRLIAQYLIVILINRCIKMLKLIQN